MALRHIPPRLERLWRRLTGGRAPAAVLAALVVIGVSASFPLILVVEGLWSLARFDEPHRALLSQLWRAPHSEPPPGEALAASVADRERVEELLDAFFADGVGLGNTPYRWLKTDRTRINERLDGCLRQKPNRSKTIVQIRSHAFELFDPVTAFWDTGARLSPQVRAFFDTYGFRETSLRTNEFGERQTFPASDAQDVVLIAGDSVAAGTGLDGRETLASQLQARDDRHRYVNLGVNAAHAKDIACNLEGAAERYRPPRVRWLIYIYCENDFKPDEPYGEPEQVARFLREYVEENEIGRVTVVYAPYVYNVVPQITRFPGSRGDGFPHHGHEKRRLREQVEFADFEWVDFGEIALAANREGGSQFSALALFVDQVHHSREGVRRLAERLLSEIEVAPNEM